LAQAQVTLLNKALSGLICYFVVGSVVGSVVEGNDSSVGAPFIQVFQTN